MANEFSYKDFINARDEKLFAEGRHNAVFKILGAHVVEGGVRFAVWAPNARRVSLVGDFNGWERGAYPMRLREQSGIWEIFIPGLAPGALYKYAIVGRDGSELPLKSDPVGFAFEPRPNTASVVWSSKYSWQSGWKARQDIRSPVSIYEVHLGSWRRRADGWFMNYRDIAAELVPYVKSLGFTHIELLPVMEHPLDESWGYQPIGMFAPTSRFGSPDDLKFLIDFAHQNELGVILDFVPAHFPRDAFALSRFDGTALYEHADRRRAEQADWGTKIYDFSKPQVRDFLISSALFWAEEYRADALRFDAVSSILYLDYSKRSGEWTPNERGGNENLDAIKFMHDANAKLYARASNFATFAEESTLWKHVSAPVEAGGLGFGYKWNMGWMNDVLSFIKSDPILRRDKYHSLVRTASYAFDENFVLPLSHDEVVHMKGSLWGKAPGNDADKFATLRALLAFQWTYPGRKLLFMGGEFAASAEWNELRSLDWREADDPRRKAISRLVRELNKLYANEPDLHAGDSCGESFHWVAADDANRTITAFARGKFLVVANWTPVMREDYLLPITGEYEEALSTDWFDFHGGGFKNGRRDACSLTLPPLSVIIMKKRS